MATLFDDASLVMIPSGYKDDKLYSIKPTSGDGDFTFSRDGSGASPATRVNSAGLIEKGRTNLLLQSNQFDTTWVKVNTTLTSGQSGYDGTNNAWLVNKSAASARIEQYISSSGVQTLSAYAKAGTLNWTRLNVDTDWAYYDLENGVVGTATGSNVIDHSIEDVGNGWYRCVFVVNRSITTARIYPADADNNSGGTSGNIYIQNAQLEKGLVATSYIETTTAAASAGILGDMPRLDYSGGATCPSLLLEPARTNLITQSEYFGAWTTLNSTVTNNDETSPEGVENAALCEYNITSGNGYIRLAHTAAQTVSFYVKYKDVQWIMVYLSGLGAGKFIDIQNGAVGGNVGSGATAEVIDAGNDWKRIVLKSSSANITQTSIYAAASDGSYSTITLSGGIYLYGAQAEAGSYPTSYVPTYGSATARNQCFANKTGVSSLIGQTEGTLFLDFKLPKIATPQNHTWVSLKDIAQNNRILLYFLANSETLRAQIKASGTANNFNLGTISNGDRVKIAIAYKSGDSAIYVNGSNSATSTNTLSFGTMDIIDFTDSSAPFEGNANQMLVFPTRLTNAELESLTTI